MVKKNCPCAVPVCTLGVIVKWGGLDISERTTAGLAAARARGRLGGRRPKLGIAQLAHAPRLL